MAWSRDVIVLLFQRLVRRIAYGQSTLVLALFLQELAVSPNMIGVFMSSTLIGDIALSLVVSFYADRLGRRRVIMFGCVTMALSGAVFATSSNYWVLLMAAIVGVISPSGDETGPFKVIEESTLAYVTSPETRADIFSWHGWFGTIGGSIGWLTGGLLSEFFGTRYGTMVGYKMIFWMYCVVGVVLSLMTLGLTKETEVRAMDPATEPLLDPLLRDPLLERDQPLDQPEQTEQTEQTDQFREKNKLIIKLCVLFALDSFGYAFMSNPWLIVYFSDKFGMSQVSLGSMLFSTTLLGSITVFVSSMITKAIGPEMAMIATKIPSALSMSIIPLFGNVVPAMLLFMFRAATDPMDVVPRQVFLSSIVDDSDRTKVMGLVNVVKTVARVPGPMYTGFAMQHHVMWTSFAFVGIFESAYALSIIYLFKHG